MCLSTHEITRSPSRSNNSHNFKIRMSDVLFQDTVTNLMWYESNWFVKKAKSTTITRIYFLHS
jgi:hypothetical protein